MTGDIRGKNARSSKRWLWIRSSSELNLWTEWVRTKKLLLRHIRISFIPTSSVSPETGMLFPQCKHALRCCCEHSLAVSGGTKLQTSGEEMKLTSEAGGYEAEIQPAARPVHLSRALNIKNCGLSIALQRVAYTCGLQVSNKARGVHRYDITVYTGLCVWNPLIGEK